MFTTIRRTHPSLRVAAVTLSLLAFGLASPLMAIDADCDVLGSDDLSRDCTASEQLGKCLLDAMDSYSQCREELGLIICGSALVFDGIMCFTEVLAPS